MTISLFPSTKRAHIVLFAYEAWGHTRPLCSLAVRLAQSRPIDITFFTTQNFRPRVSRELRRNVDPADHEILDRIRVVALQHDGLHPLDNQVLESNFAEAYERLTKSQPLTCPQTGIGFDPIASPDAVIIDFYGRVLLETVRRHNQKDVKVFVWFAGAASQVFRLYGPEELGGVGDLNAKSEVEAAEIGLSKEEAALQVVLGKGNLIKIPGIPPMYDYEIEAQELLGKGLVGGMTLAGHDTFKGSDGVVLASPEWYEPETISALRQWFSESSRPVFALGPMVAHSAYTTSQPALDGEQSEDAVKIKQFLDSTLRTHGENSLLYFSLGTSFWPRNPAKVWAFLDVVIELQLPFIMSHAVPYAVIPDAFVQKVQDYGKGLLASWSPQQLILEHPATGWFATHGGHSSVLESIMAGVPMICWPFSFDQPLNVAHLTDNLDVAYELFEIRDARRPHTIYRTGKIPLCSVEAVREEAHTVLKKAFGDDGERKRSNIRRLQEQAEKTWIKSGPSIHATESFLDSI